MTPEEVCVERIRATLRLLGDEHITSFGRLQVERVLRDIEERTGGWRAHEVTSGYPTPEEWHARFEALGVGVRRELYDKALLACPPCATRGVPISWAVVAAEATRNEDVSK